MTPAEHHVAVLGASPKPARYANQCIRLLQERGYRITPIHPKIANIEGLDVSPDLASVPQPVHTLTLYVGSSRLEPMIADIAALKPARVIFNPGTESDALQDRLDEAGIPWQHACTLVMLRTGVFLEDI